MRGMKVDHPGLLLRTATRRAALLAAGALIWCGGASATPSCQGTYAATSLQPLPDRVVVDLDIRDRSQRNLMLADRFLRGMREAGVMVGQDANVVLHVSTSRLGEMSSGASRGAERSYSELGGLAGGGMRPTLPPIPERGTTASRSAAAAQPLLALRVDATEGKNTRIVWIATVQCRMTRVRRGPAGTGAGQCHRRRAGKEGGAAGVLSRDSLGGSRDSNRRRRAPRAPRGFLSRKCRPTPIRCETVH